MDEYRWVELTGRASRLVVRTVYGSGLSSGWGVKEGHFDLSTDRGILRCFFSGYTYRIMLERGDRVTVRGFLHPERGEVEVHQLIVHGTGDCYTFGEEESETKAVFQSWYCLYLLFLAGGWGGYMAFAALAGPRLVPILTYPLFNAIMTAAMISLTILSVIFGFFVLYKAESISPESSTYRRLSGKEIEALLPPTRPIDWEDQASKVHEAWSKALKSYSEGDYSLFILHGCAALEKAMTAKTPEAERESFTALLERQGFPPQLKRELRTAYKIRNCIAHEAYTPSPTEAKRARKTLTQALLLLGIQVDTSREEALPQLG